ncbi:GTP-binding protein [Zobellia laminariae]|uniref:GTP-binding protein n=1 Tax=Zobellia laminariae TaxID=248906 RepID=UPI0026F41397|nr:GTP-binding protein [Zobellia laminariae]WKX78418.1 GTP-binding protein [Zobellia laminariae]
MKPLPNEIVLRPRFQLDIAGNSESILKKFETAGYAPFLVKRMDEHVFLKFDVKNNHFWSPQLHLQIDELDASNCRVHGIFGPNPTLWTFFMFIHFAVACLFIIIGIWAYSSASLNKPYHLQLGLMAMIVVVWFVLYFFGRSGKRKGKPQMEELYGFMMKVLT